MHINENTSIGESAGGGVRRGGGRREKGGGTQHGSGRATTQVMEGGGKVTQQAGLRTHGLTDRAGNTFIVN